ncbi:nucleoside triphosphate pyrophosphohydrolase [Irregularibacter muris]|uniref:Nucleoside triphosphate pyrophosphohydrolase n=1 Tax=Irregularibacter muris TaxID=1796619 RepID=A0AAE3HEJ0_9FIRM|nr:nucleoside triphosphate pyrophosphohydrolase [Irregularibacter muris]MCR1899022.1 nucleoside triphosphate pyrophosphohydrolase [Irregularibacter muris]
MKAEIMIIGLGPGNPKDLSLGAYEELKNNEYVFLRTDRHPVVSYLQEKDIAFQSLDWVYQEYENFQEVYQRIAQEVMERAKEFGKVIYAVPGHPLVAEETVELIIKKCEENEEVDLKIMPAMSFIDVLISSLKIDPIHGLNIIDGLQLPAQQCDFKVGNVITQVYSPFIASQVKLHLMEYYQDETPIWVIRAAGVKELEKVVEIPLYELDRLSWIDHLTSVYIPPVELEGLVGGQIERLVDIVSTLRAEHGCPWDKKQTHESLKQNLIEEAYEVIDAIDKNSIEALEEELGDVLLQIVFHSQIAKENKDFSFSDVVRGICDKLIFRHPHIFSDVAADTSEEVLVNWEKLKKIEKGMDSQTEVLKAIPPSLPALIRAYKVQKKAADVGFDWDDIEGAIEKVKEEWFELKEVYSLAKQDRIIEELGDLIFSIVNMSRFLKIQPELALTKTTEKFIDRFSFIEEQANKQGKNLEEMTLEEMNFLWKQSKIHIFDKNDKNY